jgi:hypothetical protein
MLSMGMRSFRFQGTVFFVGVVVFHINAVVYHLIFSDITASTMHIIVTIQNRTAILLS